VVWRKFPDKGINQRTLSLIQTKKIKYNVWRIVLSSDFKICLFCNQCYSNRTKKIMITSNRGRKTCKIFSDWALQIFILLRKTICSCHRDNSIVNHPLLVTRNIQKNWFHQILISSKHYTCLIISSNKHSWKKGWKAMGKLLFQSI